MERKMNRYNPIIGDIYGKEGEAHPLYKEIYKNEVKGLIEEGYELADIAIKLGVTLKTLFNRLRSWGVTNYETWKEELRAKKLIEYYSQGLQAGEIAKEFKKFDLVGKGKIATSTELIEKLQIDKLILFPILRRQ